MDLAHAATLTPLQAGTFLRNRRNELGLTADQILGLTQIPHAPYLSQLEKGKTSVGNSKHFPALARVLRLTPEEIARINPDLLVSVEMPTGNNKSIFDRIRTLEQQNKKLFEENKHLKTIMSQFQGILARG